MRTILWFRDKDLRLTDHAPLRAALDAGEVIPLFVVDPNFADRSHEAPHSAQFLVDSMQALAANLADRGSRLVVATGTPTEIIPKLAQRWRADRIVAHGSANPALRAQNAQLRNVLGRNLELHEGETLLPPGTLRTGSGKPYAVFSQFARVFRQLHVAGRPLAAPKSLPPVPDDCVSEALPTLESLGKRIMKSSK